MAFGSKMADLGKRDTGGSGESKSFVSPWLPLGLGTRVARILPVVDSQGNVVLTDRLSPASGLPLREGNKKTGKVLQGPEPESEVPFLAAWWEVKVDGQMKPRRLILDINVEKARFNNPLWKHIEKYYPDQNSRERKAIKTMFAINVLDLSPVLYNEQGMLFYETQPGVFNLLANGASGRIISANDDNFHLPTGTSEDAAPNNKVRILEGSYGAAGGRHLFAQLVELAESVEDSDGMIRRLPEFDIRIRTQGTGIDTVRSIRNTSNFKPLDLAFVRLPRYDLQTWLKPWPNEAIEDLINGKDFNEVVEGYGIKLFPELEEVSTAYTGNTEKLDPESVENGFD